MALFYAIEIYAVEIYAVESDLNLFQIQFASGKATGCELDLV